MSSIGQIGRGQIGAFQSGSGNVITGSTWSVSPPAGHTTGSHVLTATGVGTSWAGSPFSIIGGTGTANIATQSSSTTTAGSITINVTVLGTIIFSDGVTAATYDGSAVIPDAPIIGTLTDNHNGTITVTFSPPADNGGAPITGYTATSSSGGFNASGAGSPLTISGVNKGVAQTVTVIATNSAGDSAPSSASNSVTPVTVPGVPASVVGTAGNAQVSIDGTAPADTGGLSITGYIGRFSGAHTTAAGARPRVCTAVPNGVAGTPELAAVNSFGVGAFGSGSDVTPQDTVTIPIRAPYLSTDALPGTLIYDIYDADGNLIEADVTAGFVDAGDGQITNAWGVDVQVAANGAFGDFAGVAVFKGINGSEAAAEVLYRPPTSEPDVMVQCSIAPFLRSDVVGTPGYKLRPIGGSFGSRITSGIWPIPGVTNGYAVKLTLTPDANHGAAVRILWDGG